ncbi:acyl-CoA N-acyltransferase [Clathrospora elynae]|uniref:Acyl-CoA N-acyltransferase n=1 Tax=Clathrospora elynae TaxID=706981 RepID=A0A6A5SQ31_9PLEO|nr:acyl-CoA N-acyltransferase [Clathrospora elynae]
MTQFDFHIETPRLYISHYNPANDTHCDFTVALIHSATSLKFNPSGPKMIPDREAARGFIAARAERLAKTGYGGFIVSLKPSESQAQGTGNGERDRSSNGDEIPFSQQNLTPIGTVSMQLSRIDGVPGPTIPDIGFNMHEDYHGRGYATEAVRGLMQYYTDEKGNSEFSGLTGKENENARRMFRRLGFKEQGMRSVKGIMGIGDAMDLDVWTLGIEEGRALEDFGL